MTRSISRWIPIALCCVPGVIATALLGGGIVLSGMTFSEFLGGSLGFGLLLLVLLVCPLSMSLMMRQMSRKNASSRESLRAGDCCLPKESDSALEPDRLSALRAEREALRAARSRQQFVQPLAPYAVEQRHKPGLVLGFAAATPAQLRYAVKAFAAAMG